MSRKERRTLTLSDFRGVELSASPFHVSNKRAAEMVNLTLEDGQLHKRPGWEQFAAITDAHGAPLPINGMFEYRSGTHHVWLFHAGTRFFRMDADTKSKPCDITESGTHVPSAIVPDMLLSRPSEAFYHLGRLYIIGCGDYLVYGSWDGGQSYQLRRVYEGEDTTVPVTTVSINGVYGIVRHTQNLDGSYTIRLEANATPGPNEVLEPVNLLTPWRINKLQGVIDNETSGVSQGTVYVLDATVDADSELEIENTLTGERFVSVPSSVNTGGDEDIVSETSGAVCGWFCRELNAVILRYTGSNSPWPIDNGDSVITVKFRHTPHYSEAMVPAEEFIPYPERIGGNRFGMIYGTDGGADRLFLAGSDALPNVEFYSEVDDLTYFPDLYTITTGTATYPVTGYVRISDGAMAIFKEGGCEPSIYLRSGRVDTITDSEGNLERMDAIFPTMAGNIGRASVATRAIRDFGGDPLFLSEDGVYGIVLGENIKTDDRYARERSRPVGRALRSERQLSGAIGVVYDSKYHLFINGHVYVADARYRMSEEHITDDSYSYEWFYWEGVPARAAAVLDGRLCFGTEDGRVCRFDRPGGDMFADRTAVWCEEGQLAVDTVAGGIDADLSADIMAGDMLCFDATQPIWAAYPGGGAITSIREDGRLVLSSDAIEEICRMCEGDEVYVDGVTGTGLSLGVPYRVVDIDVTDGTFALIDEGGNAVVPEAVGFTLCRRVDGIPMVIEAAENGLLLLSDGGGGRILPVRYDAEAPELPTATITRRRAVAAHRRSGVFDLGDGTHLKTLLSMTMTTQPGTVNDFRFGYASRRKHAMVGSARNDKADGFEAMDFHRFTFGTGRAESMTVRLFDRGVNYIEILMDSDSEADMSPAVLTLTWREQTGNGGSLK